MVTDEGGSKDEPLTNEEILAANVTLQKVARLIMREGFNVAMERHDIPTVVAIAAFDYIKRRVVQYENRGLQEKESVEDMVKRLTEKPRDFNPEDN